MRRTTLGSDYERRTLGSINDSQINTRNIHPLRLPKPMLSSTSVATNANHRQSMSSLAARRSSIMGNRPTKSRASISVTGMRNSHIANMRSSSNGSGSVGGSGRRSSVFGGSRNGRVIDPRPISDRSFMAQCSRALIQYLSEHNYNHPINTHLLFKPMKKDFVNIMQFLFHQLDPNWELSPKIEEDVMGCFRTLKYPFPISKTALSAVGSPHSWPPLLAAIFWLIELLSVQIYMHFTHIRHMLSLGQVVWVCASVSLDISFLYDLVR
jgi:kinetochore protein NDC80